MIYLTKSLAQYPSDSFKQQLKQEIEQLDKDSLPLHLATTQGGIVDASKLSVSVLNVTEENRDDKNAILVKIAVFFEEIIGGCSCGDDPLSANAYGEFLLNIDKTNAKTQIRFLGN